LDALNATDVRKGKLRRTTQLGKFAFADAEPDVGFIGQGYP
jgi:hypothetical protein